MDNNSHRRNSVLDPTGGGYESDTRSQLNTVRDYKPYACKIYYVPISSKARYVGGVRGIVSALGGYVLYYILHGNFGISVRARV